MKMYSSNFKLSIYTLFLLFNCIYIFNVIINRIYPFEFDTTVFFTLLLNLLETGKILSPIATGSQPFICDINLNCSFTHPSVNGQKLFTELPTDYTSGITLLFIPKLLDTIIGLFFSVNKDLYYLLQLYSFGACCLYLILTSLLLRYSNFSLTYFSVSIFLCLLSIVSISEYAANAVVGELYASIVISTVSIFLFLNFNIKSKFIFYAICSFFLGISIECKISSIFTVSILILYIIYINYIYTQKINQIICIVFLFLLPKILTLLYFYTIFNFSFINLLNFLNLSKETYIYQANAGVGWGESSIYKQINLLMSNIAIKNLIFISGFFYLSSLFLIVLRKINNLYSMLGFISLLLLASLIYPLTFKFPYTRIFSFYLAIIPLNIVMFIKCLEVIKLSPYRNFNSKIIIPLIPTIYYLVTFIPLHFPLLVSLKNKNLKYEEFNKYYPNLIIDQNSAFITGHFFSMPWDIYLSNIFENNTVLNKVPIYSSHTLSNFSIDNINNFYLLETCRWGHCSKVKKVNYHLSNYKKVPIKLLCIYVENTQKTSVQQMSPYRVYKCSVE